MSFYVNVEAKKGCSRQINAAWKRKFDGFLINTKASIKKDIEFIKNDPKQKHLTYIKDVKTWNETFTILAEGKGQVFIRAFSDEESAIQFSNESDLLRDKIKFILDNRFLFKYISGLQDAVYALDMKINGDYIENGKLSYHKNPSFEHLPQKHKHPVFKRCLELDRPDIWESFLLYQDNCENFINLKNKIVITNDFSSTSTIFQRCESIAFARDGIDYGLFGRYRNGLVPNEFDVIKSIISTSEEFEAYLTTLSTFKKSKELIS